MKNLTISMDGGVYRWVRLQAARRNMSISRFVCEQLREKMSESRSVQARFSQAAVRRSLPRDASGTSPDDSGSAREDLYN
jgi:hypothetical protein